MTMPHFTVTKVPDPEDDIEEDSFMALKEGDDEDSWGAGKSIVFLISGRCGGNPNHCDHNYQWIPVIY